MEYILRKTIRFLSKNKFEVMSLVISTCALYTSMSAIRYTQSIYENNQKLIIYSVKYNSNDDYFVLKPLGENKKILSLEITYPNKFNPQIDLISTSGKYKPNEEILNKLKELAKQKLNSSSYKIDIPVNIASRYAVDGEALSDSSNYIVSFYIDIEKKEEYINAKLIDVEFTFSQRYPTGFLFIVLNSIFPDESLDIDYMYENNTIWQSINFVGFT